MRTVSLHGFAISAKFPSLCVIRWKCACVMLPILIVYILGRLSMLPKLGVIRWPRLHAYSPAHTPIAPPATQTLMSILYYNQWYLAWTWTVKPTLVLSIIFISDFYQHIFYIPFSFHPKPIKSLIGVWFHFCLEKWISLVFFEEW